MNTLEKYKDTVFEDIKHIDEDSNEYWYARELMVVLEYKKWQNFKAVINNAKEMLELAKTYKSQS